MQRTQKPVPGAEATSSEENADAESPTSMETIAALNAGFMSDRGWAATFLETRQEVEGP